MTSPILHKAFEADAFEKGGIELIELLSKTFTEAVNRPVIPYMEPEEQYAYWKKDITKKGTPLNLFKDVINRSILYHHPHYMGHQTAVPALPTILSSLVIDFLSNGMGVYEVGMVGNTMERVVCEHLCTKLGLGEEAGGFVTSGGTLGTLTAILTAKARYLRQQYDTNFNPNQLAIITSTQSHYCIERAALTMGIPANNIIKVPVNEKYQMRTDLLEDIYNNAKSERKKIFCVVASAPSTSTGTYDNLREAGNFCRHHNIWFHADGAHGAAAIFSKKYKHLLDGIEMADSIVMDFRSEERRVGKAC